MTARRVWRTETWLPWRDVLLVLEPGTARLVVPSRLSRAASVAAMELWWAWFFVFFWVILPAAHNVPDLVGYALLVAGMGGSGAFVGLGYLAWRRLVTVRPLESIPIRLLTAGPDGPESYAEVDLGGVGTRIRVKTPWPRFSRILRKFVGEPSIAPRPTGV